MKKLLTTLTIFFISLAVSAQNSVTSFDKKGTITGKVIDATLSEPLPYVTIVVKNINGETITGSITDDNGEFKINDLPDGKMNVSVQFIGYKTQTKEINITSDTKNINLGTFVLEEEATGLDEVTVVAEVSTIEQKIDRKVVNVGKDLTTAGATASDIMNNIPSVNVDQQSGNISLRGNENVRVMVDGKLSNVPVAQLLKQIPSTSIKQIELITNPSAKYNPEGMSGIINIILHKNTNIGFNGNINLGVTKEINARFNSSIDMNYRNGKFNLYGNYGNNIGKSANYGQVLRTSDDLLQEFDFGNNNKSHLYKVGLDFYLDDKNTFSIFTNQNLYDGKGTGTTDITYGDDTMTRQLFDNETDNVSSQYNFAYRHDFKKDGERLDVEADYNDFSQDEKADFRFVNIDFPPNYLDFVNTDRDQTTINIDYTNPLSESTKLEAGLEARLFNSDILYNSTGQSFTEDGDIVPTPGTDFTYSRDIYSAYVTYGKNYEKWSYQVGLRAETVAVDNNAKQYNDDGTTEDFKFENDYFQIYPSAFFTYTPSEKNTFQLSYSRRVDRPGVDQVNPIREWSTPLISSYGNPELEPQFTNSLEVNYTRNLKKGSITAGVFYRIIEDEINRALYVDRIDLDKTILTFDNFENTSAYGIELSSNYRPTKWWSLNASFDLYSQKSKGISEELNTAEGQAPTVNDIVAKKVEVDNLVWNVRMNNNFSITKDLTFSLFGMYRGMQKGIQFERQPMYFVNTGLRYNFMQNATVSFNYNDIFNTMKFEFESDRPYPSKGEFNWESNSWYVGLSYRFGGNKYRAVQRKNRDNNEKSGGGGFL
ncbi:MAG: TonB-dependent receptor [Flavobacteriaceae bacterium]|nr:TonB-dependent receptor [Mangrovimonas sp.]